MRNVLLCLAIFCISPFTSASAGEQPKQDGPAALRGTWKLNEIQQKEKSGEFYDSSYWWIIQGDKVFYGGKELAKLTIDPKTTPRCIDLAFQDPERVFEGIYTLDGDTLKICVNRHTGGVSERPTAFSTKDKDDWRLLIFKRDKERKADDTEGLSGFVGFMIRAVKEKNEIFVEFVMEKSPAKKAGLKKGDLLLKVGDLEAKELATVVKRIRQAKPGSELALTVKRDGKDQEVTVKVGVFPFLLLE